MAELMIRRIFLPGMGEEDQLAKIFYIFGTPTEEEWPKMQALHKYVQFASCEPISLRSKFGAAYSDEAIDLVAQLMKLNPHERLTAEQALEHAFFKTAANPATAPADLPFDELIKSKKKE